MSRFAALAVTAVVVAGAIAAAGWYVSTLHGEIAHQAADLARLRAKHAEADSRRQAQARRAIDTARRQERESRDEWERAYAKMQGERDRLADDLSGAVGRLRNVRATEPRGAACGDRVPEATASAADAGDPIGLLIEVGERLFGIAAEADAAAVQARIERAWIRAVTD